MRLLLSAAAIAGLLAAGCATKKTYETVLDVCSSGNGAVKSAKVGKSMVYEETSQLSCKPLTVQYKVTGEG